MNSIKVAPDNILSGVYFDALFTNAGSCGIISELTVNILGGI